MMLKTIAVLGLGLGLVNASECMARSDDNPLDGQVWEVVITSVAMPYAYHYTMEFEFSGNCIAVSTDQTEAVGAAGIDDDRDIEPTQCQSQFALTEANGNFDGTTDYTYAFSYTFDYRWVSQVVFGVGAVMHHQVETATGDTDCAGFEFLDVGETRSDVCGLPELGHPDVSYESVRRTR